jgi:hypothetical protein
MRFFLFVPTGAPAIGQQVAYLSDQNGYYGVSLASGDILRVEHGTGASPTVFPTASRIMRDRWHCIEWKLTSGGASPQAQLWLDSVEATELMVTKPALGPLEYVGFGGAAAAGGWGTFDLWYDEVALDDKRIGCDK